jgi:magnesium chelatase subunit D
LSPFDLSWDCAPPAFADAVQAATLLAVDPAGLGGMVLRSWAGPVREDYLAHLIALFPAGTKVKKIPLNISDDRLLGGLDLAATLSAGRPVIAAGIMAEARGGILLLAMAERISAGTAAKLAAAADQGGEFAVIALDEGIGPDEAAPASLAHRLAFTVNELPGGVSWPSQASIAKARAALPSVVCGAEVLEQICAISAMLGVASLRACIFAQRAACAAAALRGAAAVEEPDIALAARLVLAPLATQIPQQAPPPDVPEPEPEPESQEREQDPQMLEDRVEDVADAVLPDNLLAAILAMAAPRRATRSTGKSGATASLTRGRPLGARRGALKGDARLAVLDTLRAAAPWQRLRKPAPGARIAVRPEDFHIKRFKEQARRIAIFAVDASGSSALNRLAEAKGAIQILLADCYVQRDEVALIAFRGTEAEILLPPTGALARVRRGLAALPGGGPTPLALGITAAFQLADSERRRGKLPLLVLLTDGGANIGQDGKPGRAQAAADAMKAAKICGAANIPALVVDTAPRRNAFVAQLAAAMAARYLPLPYANAASLSRAVEASHDRLAA